MRHYKRRRPDVRIAVIGCMAQNHGDRIPVALDHVDYVVGPDGYRELEGMLFSSSPLASPGTEGGRKKEKSIPKIWVEQNDFENYEGIMARLDGSVTSHVAVTRGCDMQCAYCIVPKVRGVERSRNPDAIVEEVRCAVEQGVREVCLLGQTVNSYRFEGCDFAELLRRVNAVDGLSRTRFTSPHPSFFNARAITAMAECETVCNHVHLPLQSGSDAVLRAMRRPYTRTRYLGIVAALRRAVPDLAVTTDVIVGFPGETEEDFEATLDLMREVRFDHAFMFAYSPRAGTPAFDLVETSTPKEKQERLERLIELQMGFTEQRLDARVGREEEILVENRSSRDAAEWVGKTRGFKKVILPAAPGVHKGALVRARILERRGTVLRGQPLKVDAGADAA
jgi:tRNA-2-methylthio-N6-dimethylallyladenosine synthase